MLYRSLVCSQKPSNICLTSFMAVTEDLRKTKDKQKVADNSSKDPTGKTGACVSVNRWDDDKKQLPR